MASTKIRADQITGLQVINAGNAMVDFGSAGSDIASVVITGQTLISPGSKIIVSVLAIDSADHSADEHLVEQIAVRAGNIVAGVGFTIYAVTTGLALRGQFNVSWFWI